MDLAHANMYRMYEAGFSPKQISELFGLSVERVQVILTDQALKTEKRIEERRGSGSAGKQNAFEKCNSVQAIRKLSIESALKETGACLESESCPGKNYGRYCVWPTCFKKQLKVMDKKGESNE